MKIAFIKSTLFLLSSLSLLLAEPTKEVNARDFKVINWNVLYGFNHKKSIKEGSNWIKQQRPDVVGLQELNGHTQEGLVKLAGGWGHDHAVTLKKGGFPIGLTSKKPIKVIERRVKGFHHGYLHCETYGIHFFIVHFWPKKDNEAKVIIEKIKPLLGQGKKVIVMGDFNTHSRKDKMYLATKNKSPLYEVVSIFESVGFVDLIFKHNSKAKYSCPTPIIIPRWAKTMKEVKAKRGRIDFIFANKRLQKFSTSGKIVLSKEVEKISDHYPLIVKFKRAMINDKKL